MRNYLFIEKIRYQNKLLVLIDVPEELHAYTIPKLTLQPLIENAIIHGFHNSLNEVIIAVTADSDEKSIILHIKITAVEFQMKLWITSIIGIHRMILRKTFPDAAVSV